MQKTPLYNSHIKLGAKMLEFHGWVMPIQYTGIVAEHLAVRNKAGIFDVSHMGEFEIKGDDAYEFVQYLITNNLRKITPGAVLYTPMCNKNGGIVDDLFVYLFNKNHLMLVVNASNIDKDLKWIVTQKTDYKIEINDISDKTALVALQGPESAVIIEKVMNTDFSLLKRFQFAQKDDILISRTGYTGEDGFEIYTNAERILWLWNELIKRNVQPVGLGARDTLRLEKKYILYGNDADLETTPLEAGIDWTVDFSKPDFIGKNALLNSRIRKKLVFMELQEKGIPRHGSLIKDFSGSKTIGEVTSGSYSPSLEKGIALGYIDPDYNDSGICIEIRGRLLKGRVYERTRESKIHKNT